MASLYTKLKDKIFGFTDEETGDPITFTVWRTRFVDYIMMVAGVATADITFDWFTTFVYFDSGLYVFGFMSIALLLLAPFSVWFYLRRTNSEERTPFYEHALTISIWKGAFKAMKTGRKGFGLVFEALGEACLEAFPTSVIQQFSTMSTSCMNGKLFGFISKFFVLRVSILMSISTMSKTLWQFDFYGIPSKQIGPVRKLVRLAFRVGEVGTRSLTFSFFWLLLRKEDAARHGLSSYHLPLLMVWTVFVNCAMIMWHLPDVSKDELPIWALMFVLGSPPKFLTAFALLTKRFLLYRFCEIIVLVLILAKFGDEPLERIRARPFFACLLVACLITMLIALAIETTLKKFTRTNPEGYIEMSKLEDVETGEEKEVPDDDAMGPLSVAVKNNDMSMVKLIGPFIDVNDPDENFRIPISYASRADMVLKLASLGTNMHSIFVSRALGRSLMNNLDDLTEALMNSGANIDEKDCRHAVHEKLFQAINTDAGERVTYFTDPKFHANLHNPVGKDGESLPAEYVKSTKVWNQLIHFDPNFPVKRILKDTVDVAPVDVIMHLVEKKADSNDAEDLQTAIVSRLLTSLTEKDVAGSKVFANLLKSNYLLGDDEASKEKTEAFEAVNYNFLAKAGKDDLGNVAQKLAYILPTKSVRQIFEGELLKNISLVDALVTLANHGVDVSEDRLMEPSIYESVALKQQEIGEYGFVVDKKHKKTMLKLRSVKNKNEVFTDDNLKDLFDQASASGHARAIVLNIMGDDCLTDDGFDCFGLHELHVEHFKIYIKDGKSLTDGAVKKLATFVGGLQSAHDSTHHSSQDSTSARSHSNLSKTMSNLGGASVATNSALTNSTGFSKNRNPLRLLHISFVDNGTISDEGLIALGDKLPGLAEDISLNFKSNIRCTDKALSSLGKRINEKTVQRISYNFEQNRNFTDFGLKQLALRIPSKASHITFNFSCNENFTDESLVQIGKKIPEEVEYLHFDFGRNDNFGDYGLQELVTKFPVDETSKMTYLSFNFKESRDNLYDTGFLALVDKIPKTVKTLSLDFGLNNHITDVALQRLAKKIPPEAVNISLNFASNKVVGSSNVGTKADDDGGRSLVTLANWIPEGATNIYLNFEENDKFTKEDFENVAERLSSIDFINIGLVFAETENFDDECLEALAKGFPVGAKNISFNLQKSSKVTDKGLQDFASKIPPQATIIDLDFAHNKELTTHSFKRLAEHMPESAVAVMLNFENALRFTDRGLAKLAKHMPPHAKIIRLSMQQSTLLTDKGIEDLAERLPTEATEIKFDFKKNHQFTDKALKALGTHMPKTARSINLNFAYATEFTDAGVRDLAKGIQSSHATNLKLGFASSRKITDQGLMCLATCIPKHLTVIHLDFQFNDNIGDGGLKKLIQTIHRNSKTYTHEFHGVRLGEGRRKSVSSTHSAEHEARKSVREGEDAENDDEHFSSSSEEEGEKEEDEGKRATLLPKGVTSITLNFQHNTHVSDKLLDYLSKHNAESIKHMYLNFEKTQHFRRAGLEKMVYLRKLLHPNYVLKVSPLRGRVDATTDGPTSPPTSPRPQDKAEAKEEGKARGSEVYDSGKGVMSLGELPEEK